MEDQIKSLALRFNLFEEVMADYISSTVADTISSDCSVKCIEDILQLLLEYVPEESIPEEEDFLDFCEDVFLAIRSHLPTEEEEEDDDEDLLEDGCCEMCERFMPLTRHHLIPREEHKKYKKMGYTHEVLNTCALICRPCHSAVHRTHDNATLASEYNTVDALMADENIVRFVKWARKQRLRTTRDARNPKIHYAR
mmetsp:Transcript_15536/g.19891  ORF Transcript_15536/g.19891 Transcript_15536/m.19891 type:complete len:196 (-) Transcript_15536:552-1139(-)